MNTTKALGDRGEAAAAQYLRQRGFALLASQWRCRYGELDLVARDRDGTISCVCGSKAAQRQLRGPAAGGGGPAEAGTAPGRSGLLSQSARPGRSRPVRCGGGLYGWGSPPPPAGIFGKCVLKNSQKERAT